MEDLDENLLKAITHYQSGLERYLKRQDEAKMLHSLSRLYKLPIRTCHLENTGVGRTVNSLRKLDGKVGNAAKALVAKWKEMVVQEENKQLEDNHESDEKHSSSHENKERHKKDSSDKHKSKRKHTKHDTKENKMKEKRKRSHSSSDQNNESDEDNTEDESAKRKKVKHESTESNNTHASEDESESSEVKTSKKHKHKSSNSKKDHKEKSKSKEKPQESSPSKDKKKNHKSKETKESDKEKHHHHHHSKHKKSKQHSSEVLKNNEDKGSSAKSSIVPNGIGTGSGCGTSFADALGMCEPPFVKKKKSQIEKQREPSPPNISDDESPNEHSAGKEPLENLDINIATLLPSITPNYRPLGLPVDDQPKKLMTDDEALSRVMMNKNQRTKVYSGNKVIWGKVPSLFDLCVRILQDNLDALEYTGGVPYSILKPILEKATANQLYMMEHHNPYLIDDSDELWKLHCQKEFRNKTRDEMETWRDMYMRCLDEREAKLRALTANIKQAQDKSLPVRTTKLAYVDSVAKPPRNIAKKQLKNDSGRPTPSSKLLSLATRGEASKVAVPNPGARAVERASSSSHQLKVKKAPLMAKTLSLFKNRFRR